MLASASHGAWKTAQCTPCTIDLPASLPSEGVVFGIRRVCKNNKNKMKIMKCAVIFTALCSAAAAQPMPPEMRDALVSEFQFSSSDLIKVETGKAVSKIAPTARPYDIRMVGVILVHVSSEDFIKAFRDIEHFEMGSEVQRTGRFKSPPSESDFAGYHLPDLSKADLLACRPGNCAYKMPAEAMKSLQTKIDWTAPDANARAEVMIQKLFIGRLLDYQQRGDPALAVYYDTSTPFSVAEGLHSLIGGEAGLWSRFPGLLHYAEKYPQDRPPDTDDFFYWQEAAFGLKHVLRLQHVIVQKVPSLSAEAHYAIISKMLFATHYFRAAIEFNYIYPVRTAAGESAVYFVAFQRSYVDGLTGIKGAILRRIAESRSPASLTANLVLARQQLERKP